MTQKYRAWFSNAPVAKKIRPLQVISCVMVMLISLLSIFSISILNKSTQDIFEENVDNTVELYSIIRTMYVCRVAGRDILLQNDPAALERLYAQYCQAFDDLDKQMDDFAMQLSGDKQTEFFRIIEEKNVYRDSMILSADIKMAGGDYDEALYALTVVTPIANEFFGSLDDFLEDEEKLMTEALATNDLMVNIMFVVSIVANIGIILFFMFFVGAFTHAMSASLVALEKSVSKIADTGNMRMPIPNELFTRDEVGSIAVVVDKLKNMLVDISYMDVLTGGYNATAYHEELNDIFAKQAETGDIVSFWCVVSDMNNLKLINDKLGHIEGDSAIRSCYAVLKDNFAEFGKTFRIGGDEFVSILFNCTEDDVKEKLEVISSRIESLNIRQKYMYSLASGFRYFEGYTREDYEEFFRVVDKEMYSNKNDFKKEKTERLEARTKNLNIFKDIR